MKFHFVRVDTPGIAQGEVIERDSVAWCSIDVKGKPSEIKLTIVTDDSRPLFIKNGSVTRTTPSFLNVPVRWQGHVPRTRARGQDNIDVVRIGSGYFTDIQVSVVTRAGRFYVCCQCVFQGWARFDSSGVCQFKPGSGIHNYEGVDFARSFPAIAEALKPCACQEDDLDLSIQNDRWESPRVEPVEGVRRGEVLFYNAVTGIGFIRDLDDSSKTFVHFSDIVDGGNGTSEFPILLPMTGVYFKVKEQEGGRTKAVGVRSVA